MNYTDIVKHCKIIFGIILMSIIPTHIIAQVTIGSDREPNNNAILEFKQNEDGTSEKGLLLPRVNLISTANPYPLTTHVKGMLVYNKTDDNNIKPGVFHNDGTQWKRIDIIPGGEANQVLTLDDNLQPVWGELDIPDVTEIGYVMRKFAVSNRETGHEFTNNAGYAATAQNYIFDSKWFKFNMGSNFTVTPQHRNNRLIVTMQAMVQSNSSGTQQGWVDYAGGIFINDSLKNVKLGQFSHTGNRAFEIMTMYLIVDNLRIGQSQQVDIAVARIASRLVERIGIGIPSTPAPNPPNLSNFMAKPFIAIQYYEDPSSPTN